jgi:hypothetical protein
MKLRIIVAAGLCGLLGPVGVAAAADAVVPAQNTVKYKTASGWTITIARYAWLAGLEGDVGAGEKLAAQAAEEFGVPFTLARPLTAKLTLRIKS